MLPGIILALIKISIFDSRDKLLRNPQMIAEISFSTTGKRNHGTMVKIIVPDRVEAIAVLLDRADQEGVLGLVLGDDDGLPISSGRVNLGYDLREYVHTMRSVIVNGLGSVETQSVEVILGYPMRRVGEEEVAHRAAVLTIKIDAIAPLRIFAGEIVVGILSEVIPV